MELSSIPAEVEEDDETANYEELLRRIQEKLNSPEYQPGEACMHYHHLLGAEGEGVAPLVRVQADNQGDSGMGRGPPVREGSIATKVM